MRKYLYPLSFGILALSFTGCNEEEPTLTRCVLQDKEIPSCRAPLYRAPEPVVPCPCPCDERPGYFDADWYGSVDFLWWQANSGSVKSRNDLVGDLSADGFALDITIDSQLTQYDFKWEPGFRLGIGRYLCGMDNWDFLLNWTFYYGKAKGVSIFDISIPGIPAADIPPLLNITASEKSSWDLNYNVFDLEVGRSFYIEDKLVIRPLFGFRGATINQDYHANLGNVNFDITGLGAPITAAINAKAENEFSGVGIRGGARIIWEWSPHLGIIGQFSGSVLLGEFEIESNVFTDASLGFGGAGITVTGDAILGGTFFKARTNLEGLFGLYSKWAMGCDDSQLLEMTFGYETSIWFKQNEINSFLTANSSSTSSLLSTFTGGLTNSISTSSLFGTTEKNLALRGLTFNVRYSF